MRKMILVTIGVVLLMAPFIPRESFSAWRTKAAAATGAQSSGGCLPVPTISPTIPADVLLTNQQYANCFAWQQFIALNWKASTTTCAADPAVPAAKFGEPNDTSPVVWETYKEASEVFLPNAVRPSDWCSQQSLPASFAKMNVKNLKKTSAHGFKVLTATSKDADNPNLKLSDFTQAFTPGSWLTAQNKYITLYEIRLNQDEFNYIRDNKLYDATVQQTFVQNPGINLPDGSAQFSQYGNIGSIELKAAWIQLDDPSLWPYFKTSQAYVVYPWGPTSPKLVTVGLVGLHIIHKTVNGQQFFWATFEHVNNAPSTSDISNKTLKSWYTYYNANCDPSKDYYKCAWNAGSSPTTCLPYFPQQPGDPYQVPMQVVRTTPISTLSTNNIASLNQFMWGQISAANSDSVFLNYQLVNVLWPNNNTTIPAGATTPLTSGDPQPTPNQQIVANTTMETYFQSCNTCLDCHVNAPIAKVSPLPKPLNVLRLSLSKSLQASSGTYASDYSFLLSRAQVPSPPKVIKKTRAGKRGN